MMDFGRLAVPNLSKVLRAQDRDRFRDPNNDRAMPRIFIAYTRADGDLPWTVAGIVRLTQRLTGRHLRRVRQQLKIAANIELKLVASSNRNPDVHPARQWRIGL